MGSEKQGGENQHPRVETTGFLAMPGVGPEERAAEARRWLERMVQRAPPRGGDDVDAAGGYFDGFALCRLKVVEIGGDRALCTFTVPNPLADEDGNWRAGPIASVIDYVGAAAIISAVGILKASVDLDISYFSPAKVGEEVEVKGKVMYTLGKLTAVIVEIRKKGSGQLVALGKQWLTTTSLGSRNKL